MDLLRLNPHDDLSAKLLDLVNELRSQLLKIHVCEVLELVFLGEGTDHGAAVPLLEETFEQTANAVLLLDRLTEALLVCEGLLEVLFARDWFRLSVQQLKREVPHDPHEAGEVLGELLRVGFFARTSRLDLNVLCEVDHQRKLLERIFIDTAHRVVNEVAGQQNRK